MKREEQIFTCAVNVTELDAGMLTLYQCSWGIPAEVVNDTGSERVAPVDRELPPATAVVS